MILMLAPGPNMTFGAMPSGASYVSDSFCQIQIVNDSTADQSALQGAGCALLSAFGNWGNFGFNTLANLYSADAASNLVLPGVTGFPANTLITVLSDSGNTGTWLKTGTGTGSGNWTQKSTQTFAGVQAVGSANSATLVSHTSQISSLSSGLAVTTSGLAVTSGGTVSNTSAISGQATSLTSLASSLAVVSGGGSANTSAISATNASVTNVSSSLNSGIAVVAGGNATNSANLSAFSAATVSSMGVQSGGIVSNTSSISGLSGQVTSAFASISAVSSGGAVTSAGLSAFSASTTTSLGVLSGGQVTLASSAATNAAAIAVQSGGLASANTTISGQTTQITGLKATNIANAESAAGSQLYAGTEDLQPVITDAAGNVLLGVHKATGSIRLSPTANSVLRVLAAPAVGVQTYSGPNDIQPVVADTAGNLLVGVRKSTGALVAQRYEGVVTGPVGAGLQTYTGADDVLPLVVDQAGNVLLGMRQSTGLVVAAGYEGALTGKQTTSNIPLALGESPVLKDWNGFINYGQSNSMAQDAVPVISTSQPYGHMTFTNGVRASKAGNAFGGVNQGTAGTIALIESAATSVNPSSDGGTDNGETICSSMSSYCTTLGLTKGYIASPSAFIMFCSAAGHGSYAIDQLIKPGSGVPASWYQNLLDHASEAKARATDAGKSYGVHAVGWMQGETIHTIDTRSGYAAALEQLVTDINTDLPALTGQSTPVHVLTFQAAWGATDNGACPQLGVFDAVNASPRLHFVLPDYAFGPHAAANIVHFAAIAHVRMGHYYGRAYEQLVFEGRVPDCIWPISATAKGAVVSMKFRVPQLPLVLDLVSMAATKDYGFSVQDDSGTLTLSSIQVVGGDTVQMTVNRALSTNPLCRYALDNLGAGLWFTDGASGNLRDSTADSFSYSGASYPMPHFAPHCELPISTLDQHY